MTMREIILSICIITLLSFLIYILVMVITR